MAEDERPGDVHALRAEVSADLQVWASRYPLFASLYFPSLAATTVAYLPFARRTDRALVALVSLWIVTFDALVDEGDSSPGALAALASRYGAIITADRGMRDPGPSLTAGEGPFEQLDAALREVVARLAAYRTPTQLQAWWEESCRATIMAIVRQRGLGREGPVLGYHAALPVLIDSIGVEPYLALGTIIGHEVGPGRSPAELKVLARECALAIRLANDLRTWQKDETEGGFNTLVALCAEMSLATPDLLPARVSERARKTLSAHLTLSQARCHAQLRSTTIPGATASAMVQLMEFVVGGYAADQYHTYRVRDD